MLLVLSSNYWLSVSPVVCDTGSLRSEWCSCTIVHCLFNLAKADDQSKSRGPARYRRSGLCTLQMQHRFPRHQPLTMLRMFPSGSLNHAGEPDTIWTVASYQPDDYFVRYVRVSPESRLAIVEVSCSPLEAAKTKATVTYALTALSDKGNQFIDSFTEEYYRHYIFEWESAINKFLAKRKSNTSL
ncbi:MAG: hypothetical protein ACRECQ_18270 [Burkholderiaceae bacterium]